MWMRNGGAVSLEKKSTSEILEARHEKHRKDTEKRSQMKVMVCNKVWSTMHTIQWISSLEMDRPSRLTKSWITQEPKTDRLTG